MVGYLTKANCPTMWHLTTYGMSNPHLCPRGVVVGEYEQAAQVCTHIDVLLPEKLCT